MFMNLIYLVILLLLMMIYHYKSTITYNYCVYTNLDKTNHLRLFHPWPYGRYTACFLTQTRKLRVGTHSLWVVAIRSQR